MSGESDKPVSVSELRKIFESRQGTSTKVDEQKEPVPVTTAKAQPTTNASYPAPPPPPPLPGAKSAAASVNASVAASQTSTSQNVHAASSVSAQDPTISTSVTTATNTTDKKRVHFANDSTDASNPAPSKVFTIPNSNDLNGETEVEAKTAISSSKAELDAQLKICDEVIQKVFNTNETEKRLANYQSVDAIKDAITKTFNGEPVDWQSFKAEHFSVIQNINSENKQWKDLVSSIGTVIDENHGGSNSEKIIQQQQIQHQVQQQQQPGGLTSSTGQLKEGDMKVVIGTQTQRNGIGVFSIQITPKEKREQWIKHFQELCGGEQVQYKEDGNTIAFYTDQKLGQHGLYIANKGEYALSLPIAAARYLQATLLDKNDAAVYNSKPNAIYFKNEMRDYPLKSPSAESFSVNALSNAADAARQFAANYTKEAEGPVSRLQHTADKLQLDYFKMHEFVDLIKADDVTSKTQEDIKAFITQLPQTFGASDAVDRYKDAATSCNSIINQYKRLGDIARIQNKDEKHKAIDALLKDVNHTGTQLLEQMKNLASSTVKSASVTSAPTIPNTVTHKVDSSQREHIAVSPQDPSKKPDTSHKGSPKKVTQQLGEESLLEGVMKQNQELKDQLNVHHEKISKLELALQESIKIHKQNVDVARNAQGQPVIVISPHDNPPQYSQQLPQLKQVNPQQVSTQQHAQPPHLSQHSLQQPFNPKHMQQQQAQQYFPPVYQTPPVQHRVIVIGANGEQQYDSQGAHKIPKHIHELVGNALSKAIPHCDASTKSILQGALTHINNLYQNQQRGHGH